MANNLSSLIADAFTVYSQSYTKIGQLGFQIADMDGSPLQPAKIKQLVYATRLFRVIEPSLILNGGGTAIVGVVGEVNTINNLLLKLKRVLKLFSIPAFDTPLTDIVINIGEGGGASEDATYITAIAEASLAQSRRISAGTGISLTDGGALGTMQINNTNAVDAVTVDTGINPVLDVNGQIERFFQGSDPISGVRTWSQINGGNARRIQCRFSITGLTPGASTHDQTLNFGSGVSIYTTSGETPSANIFRPGQDGDYEMIATTYNGTTWKVRIF